MANLESLPDDLLIDIVDYLDTARDVSHLGASSRRAHCLVSQDGWRAFVRARFPSLTMPSNRSCGWSSVAEQLTYLDRCWEKRGILLKFFRAKDAQGRGRGRRRGTQRGQSVQFQSFVDAQLLSSRQDEMLACGAGEDLLVRWRPTDGKHPGAWRRLAGRDGGYSAGTGDVTAVSAIERNSQPEVIVGRANGDMQLLSAADSSRFGHAVKRLLPLDQPDVYLRSSPGWRAVTWTEWQAETQMIANCRSSLLTLYNLSSQDETELRPVAYYDASKGGERGDVALARCAKFMGKDAIACGAGGCREPLLWGKIRPTGLELFPVTWHQRQEELCGLDRPRRETVRAIEPAGGQGNENLLLSAWDDGSYWLLDARTSSGAVATYRDRFQPYHAASSLLVYGTERFVSGGNSEPVLRFFDFRYPKPYYHFNALPCSGQSPAPETPEVLQMQRKMRRENDTRPRKLEATSAPSRCDPASGRLCNWHELSRHPMWRPDATMFLGSETYGRVVSLAKASDLSATFYCGLRGAVAEATLTLADDIGEANGERAPPPGWTVRPDERALADIGVMETGDSGGPSCELLGFEAGIYSYRPFGAREHGQVPRQGRSRLDSALQVPDSVWDHVRRPPG